MATNDQVRALVTSHLEGDGARFASVAMQVAAAEARRGNADFASEVRRLIDRSREAGGTSPISPGVSIPFAAPTGELKDLLSASQPEVKLSDMVLPDAMRARLERVLAEQRQLALLRGHNLNPRQRLLLVGPPGCGKTMTAAALAGELHLTLFVVRLEVLVSKFLGETAGKLRLIFEQMERTRAVFLFDEFDSIGTERGRGDDVGEMRRVLNSFLVMLEQYQGASMVIAATNHGLTLDSALFRRFDDHLEFSTPRLKEIEQTLRQSLALAPVKVSVDWAKLAKAAKGLSYAEVVRAARESMKTVLLAGKEELGTADVAAALSERGRPMPRSKRK
jgi:SpoVK/Ycf46/Vps4 family AAA+-type ATPase